MKFELVDKEHIEDRPKQQVGRNAWATIVKEFVDSEKTGAVLTLDTVPEATRCTMAIYNYCTNNEIAVKVWRRGNVVYMIKEETDDGSKDL